MSVKGGGTVSDTTSSVASSREDLHDLALCLGLSSVESLAQDRFRVDRKRLENLMFGDENNPDAAARFFDAIMQETRTHITWPSRLKLGAKSKKDPHIRVIGRSEDVQIARNLILASLDTRASRVTMKIDVSYTDHSHIIGKAGSTIKRVMDETGCHIHFPDSNRTNQLEKSNQVSIAGDVVGVERARAKVRELTPLIFCFELPILGALKMTPDASSPYISSLQDIYNVQVMFRSRQKLNSTLVVVKGCEWEVNKVKEATQLLIAHMCETLASQVLVHMMIEISPQHHSIVLGRNNENLKGIMQRTSTQIIFLDPTDPNIPPLKKSNFTITGSIHNVYIARQQLIGSLPVALMFEVPENSIVLDPEQIGYLMNALDVVISTRNKPKQNIISFIIKGIERNISNIYEARRRLIAQDEPEIEVTIPQTYIIPNTGPTFMTNWQMNKGSIVGLYPNVVSPTVLGGGGLMGRVGYVFPMPPPTPPTPHHHIHLRNILPPPHPLHGDHLGHFSYSSLSLPELPVYTSLSGNASTMSSPSVSPRTVSPVPNINSEQSKRDGGDTHFNDQQKERKAPGYERRRILPPFQYKQLKLQALQAMQEGQLSHSEIRIPSSVWSGHGLSQSSPTATLKHIDDRLTTQDTWYNNLAEGGSSCETGGYSASNYLDSVPASTVLSVANLDPPDLHTLLVDIGLEKYMQLFKSQEIDLSTFRTLTDNDLKEIGVSAFGARRKMVVSIAELNKRERSPLRRSAAPGAERTNSSTNSLNENW